MAFFSINDIYLTLRTSFISGLPENIKANDWMARVSLFFSLHFSISVSISSASLDVFLYEKHGGKHSYME